MVVTKVYKETTTYEHEKGGLVYVSRFEDGWEVHHPAT